MHNEGDPVSSATHAAQAPRGDRENDISLLELARVLMRRWRLLIVVPVVAAGVSVAITTLAVKPRFVATTQLLMPQQPQSNAAALLGGVGGGLAAVAGGALPGLRNPSDQWIGLLRSRTINDGLIAQFKLLEVYGVEHLYEAREELEGDTRITAGKDGLIRVEVEDESPQRAADIANAYVTQLQALTKTLATTEGGQRRLYFEGLMRDAKDKLVKAEVALRAGGINESVLKTSPDKAAFSIAQLRAQISAQDVRVASLRTFATDASPELRRAQAEQAALRDQLQRQEGAQPRVADADGADYVARYRDFKYYETLFELLAKQYELARADEARQGASIQVLDRAIPPERKSKPQRGLIAVMTAALSFLACCLLVIVRDGRKQADPRS